MSYGKGRDSWVRNRLNIATSLTYEQMCKTLPVSLLSNMFFTGDGISDENILSSIRKISDSYLIGKVGRTEVLNLMMEYVRDIGKDGRTENLCNLSSIARLELIIDQNSEMAKAVGEYEQMEQNKDIFPYVIYRFSPYCCAKEEHKKHDGKIFSKFDPWLRIHLPPSVLGCYCELEECSVKRAKKTPELIQKPMSSDRITVEGHRGFIFDPSCAFVHENKMLRAKTTDELLSEFQEFLAR